MKKKIVIWSIIITVVLVKTQINGKIIEKYIKVSEEGKLVELKILKTQRR